MVERMDEFETDEAAALSQGYAASPRWTGAPSIELAHQVNVQCVDLICELAVSPNQNLPAFVLQNRDLWRLLEPEARQRVAAFPFVIVDLRFKDYDWWRQISGRLSMSPPEFPTFGDLALETLLFARQSAREDVNVAKAMFAMTSTVASLIASLTLTQVRTIAVGNTGELRVRWDNDPELWRDLLIASRSDESQVLAAIRRQAKLLFCGEFLVSRDR
jgi:hypothetical protein